VSANFGVWTAVPTSTVSFTHAGALPVDVTVANWPTYLDVCDGLSAIIFDTNGSITDDVFGPGASNSILGFAGPECATFVPPVISEGVAVLNGKWIDGIGPTEMPLADFNAVFIHEFGHYVNLDHSQINLLEAFDGNPSNDDAIATMFPFLVSGAAASSLHLDDAVAVSTLYPDPSFATGFGTIAGAVYRSDGSTLFQGAYVVARAGSDPRITAVGMASGARYFPGNPGGPPVAALEGAYTIPGLPADDYTIEIEEIDSGFTGGSSVGPVDPPASLPGLPEFYNGGNEAGTDPPDDPAVATTIAVAAGATTSGIDVIINGFPPAPNDACAGPTLIPSLPYTDTVDTTGATTAGTDPVQCTGGQNSNSVWYELTVSASAVVTADTIGSDYDTVLSVYTGSCGALTAVGCDDDTVGLQSVVSFDAEAGQTYLIEVTDFGAPGGGTLVLNVDEVRTCDAAPLFGCRQPTLSQKASVKLRNKSPDDGDTFVWKWLKGAATTKLEFGFPTLVTDYALCVYDEVGGVPTLKMSARVPAGGVCSGGRPCWTSKTTGYLYKNSDLTPHGVQKLVLKSGLAGKAKITLKGKGLNLDMPALPLAQATTVIVQLKNADGECWDAEYSTPALKNEPEQFKDKAD